MQLFTANEDTCYTFVVLCALRHGWWFLCYRRGVPNVASVYFLAICVPISRVALHDSQNISCHRAETYSRQKKSLQGRQIRDNQLITLEKLVKSIDSLRFTRLFSVGTDVWQKNLLYLKYSSRYGRRSSFFVFPSSTLINCSNSECELPTMPFICISSLIGDSFCMRFWP